MTNREPWRVSTKNGLDSLGVFALVSFTIARQSREIGIRMALGSTYRNVVAKIVYRIVAVEICGVGVGIIVALGLMPLFSEEVFQSFSPDPISLLAVAVLLLATSLGASVIAARRIGRIDPVATLRNEGNS